MKNLLLTKSIDFSWLYNVLAEMVQQLTREGCWKQNWQLSIFCSRS